jgi:hypothetical protein
MEKACIDADTGMLRMLRMLGNGSRDAEYSGTTACFVVFDGRRLYVANAGAGGLLGGHQGPVGLGVDGAPGARGGRRRRSYLQCQAPAKASQCMSKESCSTQQVSPNVERKGHLGIQIRSRFWSMSVISS